MKTEIDLMLKEYRRKLNYYTRRFENEKLSKDEYLEKIRPITYRIKWLQTIKKIDGLLISINRLRINANHFFNMGTAEEFLIGKINKMLKTKLDYEKVHTDVKELYRAALFDIKKTIENFTESDYLDDLIVDP